jgi:AcrR family transcriptional regulator
MIGQRRQVNDTKEKLMDTAERLIAEQGYAATSLRQIIAEAGVNLASVHYHFGSKEELLDALVLRKAGPINEDRLARLERCEREAGAGSAPVTRIVEAFVGPAFALRGEHRERLKFMGRLYAEGIMPVMAAKHFRPLMARFIEAFHRALPEVPEEELLWRFHFMIGAMAHTLCMGQAWPALVGGMAGPVAPNELAERLTAFLGAGFSAPVPLAAAQEER